MIGADLLVGWERAGAEDGSESPGELVREPEPLDELGLRLGEEWDRVRRELVDEVERDAPVLDGLADGLERDARSGERKREAHAPHVARTIAPAVLRTDDADPGQLLDFFLRRPAGDGDLGDAQLRHTPNRSQGWCPGERPFLRQIA